MRVWDRATGTCIATLTGHTEPVNSVAISPTGPGSPRISHPVSLRGDHVCRGPRVVPTPARHRPPRESSTGTELRSELENRRSVRSNSGFQRGVSGRWPPYSSVVSALSGDLAVCGRPSRASTPPLPRRLFHLGDGLENYRV
ncbi:hypothetical protein ACIPM5_36025 [Streptomyces microflavus]|uniref:hypothetical protein n=1 Tax=Streptomyces microflavus TaxID=1919 RepID=UPI00381978D1